MKKKFLKGFIIILMCLLLFGTTTAIVTHKESNKIAEVQENILNENEYIENLDSENEAENDYTVQEVAEEKTEEKNEEVVVANENSANIDNKPTTTIKKDAKEKVIVTNNETKQETTISKENPQKTNNNTQVEQPKSKETSTTQNKELEAIKDKLSCKDGKHYMDVGNSGKWFDTEAEAIAYYKSIIKEWGDKLESFDDYKSEEFKKFNEEYDKNCPCRYEVWSCFCGKWTINFYYR